MFTKNFLLGEGDQTYMGFFHGNDGMARLLKTESNNCEEGATKVVLSLWTGDLAEALAAAEADGSLTEGLVAQSAGVSQLVWRRTTAAFALQLSKEGNYLKASEYYLSAHFVQEAIDVLKKNGAFQPALAIAMSRLPEEDPLIAELLVCWAHKSVQDGNLTLAAKCWSAAGRSNEAADVLAKIASKANLYAAAVLSDDPKRAEIYAKQCFTECLFSMDTSVGLKLTSSIPSLDWGAPVLHVYKQLHKLLTTSPVEASGVPLFTGLELWCREHKIECDASKLTEVHNFMKTTTNEDLFKTRLLHIACQLVQAYMLRSEPERCLSFVSMALAVVHKHPVELGTLVKVLMPEGTQPPEAGEALIGTKLDWQCRWPELRKVFMIFILAKYFCFT